MNWPYGGLPLLDLGFACEPGKEGRRRGNSGNAKRVLKLTLALTAGLFGVVCCTVLCCVVWGMMCAGACGAQHNRTLQVLDLDWNQIGSAGAKAVAEALKVRARPSARAATAQRSRLILL